MKLLSFRIEKFRNILDSDTVTVQEDVTCLVGKNESGKTAALTALYRLKPAYGEKFVISEHYPRWLLTKDRKSGTTNSAQPISAQFELSDADIQAVEECLGCDALADRNFVYGRTYTGTVATLNLRHHNIVRHMLDSADSSSAVRKKFAAASTAESLRDEVVAAIADFDDSDEPDVELDDLRQLSAVIEDMIGESTAWQRAVSILRERMPKFFYFSQYSVLPGRVALDEVDSGKEGPASSELQTVRALLELAGTSTESLRDDDYEERTAEMEAVSNDLTDQVFEYWTQNEQLEVKIDIDKQTIQTQHPHGGTNRQAVATYLDIRVKDKRHGFTSNFGQRSAGFQWFFSFLAAFSEFGDDDNVIVLLDEPGLALHAKAQADFLRFIDERLAPSVQVIYTTHSPFMVETSKLDRVRVVEDKGAKLGTVISSEVLSVGNDTLFPLQAALGYDVAQSLFIGPNNLLVEGTSDFTYLTIISDHLKSLGREGLDDDWRILPTGGVNSVPAFVALIGRSLDVTVLVDSGAQGTQRLTNLAKEGLLGSKRLLMIGQVTGAKQADIEDLFEVGDYLTLYNRAFGTKIYKSKLQPGTRIIDRIGRTQGHDFTDHGKPADVLLRDRLKLVAKFSTETLDNFEAVIKLINATKSS